MQIIARLMKDKILTHKDVSTYLFVEKFPMKTAKELSFNAGVNYGRLTESLNKLIHCDLICRTEDYPNKYIIK